MPIYEYYCPENHTVYQFYAKTLAQGRNVPKCPDNPNYTMRRILSPFAVTGGGKQSEETAPAAPAGADDARMEAAMGAMEREFAGVDENDPRAMGRMLRRMAEITGEKIDGVMEEAVRKLEEGADPDAMEEQLGGSEGESTEEATKPDTPDVRATARRGGRARLKTVRDPRLHDYE